jgi:hypothetical protein
MRHVTTLMIITGLQLTFCLFCATTTRTTVVSAYIHSDCQRTIATPSHHDTMVPNRKSCSFGYSTCCPQGKQQLFLHHHHPTQRYMIPPSNNNNNNNNNRNKKSFSSNPKDREMEIRQQIRLLKQQGRIRPKKDDILDDDDDEDTTDDTLYANKIRQKLGPIKSKLLGLDGNTNKYEEDDDHVDDDDETFEPTFLQKRRTGQIGTLQQRDDDSDDDMQESDDEQNPPGYQRQMEGSSSSSSEVMMMISTEDDDDNANMDDDDDDDIELSNDDLIELVAQRLTEKSSAGTVTMEECSSVSSSAATSTSTKQMTTSGIGGSWDTSQTDEATQDIYQPKTGSWGAFPRPRDISKAYGGGKRVGVGYTETISSVDETRQRLQRYRVTMGIEVESEKNHATEIDDAMKIAAYAMQRGIYTSAVTALEKVTKFCSTNSKVGGKVFLELAMAYEAAGRTDEAITVYTTLSRSRTEEVSTNAKRLLYGIEAIKFMQDNVGSAAFSRKQAKMTFIDTTGLANFASNFDDVYETAYVDMDRDFYKQLTEAVVRTSREARQILLRATNPGEVGRLRIVQALRSLSRYFEEALENEIEMSRPLPEPVAIMDGKPIRPQRQQAQPNSDSNNLSSSMRQLDEYVLMSSQQMMENLAGEWRLQLIADKRGDGVKFYNSTLVWQNVDTDQMKFTSYSPQGFLTVEPTGRKRCVNAIISNEKKFRQERHPDILFIYIFSCVGTIEFKNKRRIFRRRSVEVSGTGSMITNIFGLTTKTGPVGAICSEKQIIMVDSTLLVTRGVPAYTALSKTSSRKDDEKDYFAVWRRVATGIYSQSKP